MDEDIKAMMEGARALLGEEAKNLLDSLIDNPLKALIDSEDVISDDLSVNKEEIMKQAEAMLQEIQNNENLSDHEKAKLAELIMKAVEEVEKKLQKEIDSFKDSLPGKDAEAGRNRVMEEDIEIRFWHELKSDESEYPKNKQFKSMK